LSSDSYRILSSPTTSSGCKSFSYCSSSSIGDLYKRRMRETYCVHRAHERALNKIISNRCETSNLIGSVGQYSCSTNATNVEKLRCSHDRLIKLEII
jgi:hypothetical protein